MALIKSLDSNFGIPVAYHRVTAININLKTKAIVLCVSSYISKEARANNNIPLEEIDIEIPIQDFDLFKHTDVTQAAYDWLVENVVGFEDAQDCYESFSEPSGVTINESEEHIDGGNADEENVQE